MTPDSPVVLVERVADVGVVTLARPEVRNAITVDAVRQLAEAFRSCQRDGVRAVVVQGAAGTFCAGADLGLVREGLDGDAAASLRPLVDELHDTLKLLRSMPYVSVAAVEGHAVGAGMGLALATDLRVCGPSTRLVPGYLGIGSSPDGGVSWFLSRAVGATRAASILLRNTPLDADALTSLGLADQVVVDDEVKDAALSLATQMATVPPLALQRVRHLVDQAGGNDLASHLDLERDLVEELWATHDFREGVTAMLERRRPSFRGN